MTLLNLEFESANNCFCYWWQHVENGHIKLWANETRSFNWLCILQRLNYMNEVLNKLEDDKSMSELDQINLDVNKYIYLQLIQVSLTFDLYML